MGAIINENSQKDKVESQRTLVAADFKAGFAGSLQVDKPESGSQSSLSSSFPVPALSLPDLIGQSIRVRIRVIAFIQKETSLIF